MTPDFRLADGVIIHWRPSGALAMLGNKVIRSEDPRAADELAVWVHSPSDHSLAPGGFVERLRDEGWLSDGRSESCGITPLSELVRSSFEGLSALSGPAIVVTSREAMLVPLNVGKSDLRRALRFFISRLDSFRVAAYGAALTGGYPLFGVVGDCPSGEQLIGLRATSCPADSHSFAVLGWTGDAWLPLGQPGRAGMLPDIFRGDSESDVGACARLGPVEVHRVADEAGPGEDPFWVAVGGHAHPHLGFVPDLVRDPGAKVERTSVGTGPTAELAIRNALGEGVERFALGDAPVREIVWSPASALGEVWVSPAQLVPYTAEQRKRHALREFSAGDENPWVLGEAFDGTAAYLPASLVFSPFGPRQSWLLPGHVSSNGGAAHPNRREAMLSAWMECIERDAFLRTYFAKRQMLRLRDQTCDSKRVRGLTRAIRQRVSRMAIGAISTPYFSDVVLAVARQEGRIMVGCSAKRDQEAAAIKALSEVLLQALRPLPRRRVEAESVVTPLDHALLYTTAEYADSLDWLFQETDPGGDVCASINFDMSSAFFYVRDLGGLYVARSLDTRLIPLAFGYDAIACGHPDVQKLCLEGGRDWGSPITPHPFA